MKNQIISTKAQNLIRYWGAAKVVSGRFYAPAFIFILWFSCSSPVHEKITTMSLATNTTVPGFVTKPNTFYDATTWNITGTVVLSSGVKWKGGHFTGHGAAFTSLGNCIGVSIDSVILDSSLSTLFDGNLKPFITYNGTDSSFLYKNILASHISISGKTMLYGGTYEGPKTFHDVCFGMTINDVVRTIDSNSMNQLVVGQSIYKFRWARWNLVGNGKIRGADGKTLVDNGVVQINSGNGQGKDCYRNGKAVGYWFRCWGVKLGTDPDQDVKLENCVDANSVVYGTLDFRIDPGQLQSKAAIPLTGCNAYFISNTSAYKADINAGYVTNAIVLGQTVDDLGHIDTIHIFRNIAFGAFASGAANNSSLVKNNSSGVTVIDSGKNIDIPPGQPVPAGLVDANLYSLVQGIGAQGLAAVQPPAPTPTPTPTPSVIHDTIYVTNYVYVHDTTLKTVHDTAWLKPKVLYPSFDGSTNTWHFYFDNGTIQ